jgi:hypothetical protein
MPGVYFWQLQTADGTVELSATWTFRIDARRTTRVGLLPPDLDVNGDGLADVVALTEQGNSLAFLLGSRTEISAAPYATLALGSPSLALAHGGDGSRRGMQDVVALSNSTACVAQYGGSASAASTSRAIFDIDLDGLGDRLEFHSSGDLRLHLGSESGSSPALSLRNAALPMTAADVLGDVNGDGFFDLALGSPRTAPPCAWTYVGSSLGIEPSQTLQYSAQVPGFGESVAPAGDVNGDGYADLVVRVGRRGAAVYLGGSSATLHRWLVATSGDLLVARAGDVNGDGFGDVLAVPVGRDEGWLYPGSAEGLAETPVVLRGSAWSGCVNFTGAPGDVNGDGFDDVVVGAPGVSEVRVLYGAATMPLTRVVVRRGADGSRLGESVL